MLEDTTRTLTYNHIDTMQDNPLLNRFVSFVWSMSLDNEAWRELADTESHYYISSRGRVLSLCRGSYRLLQPYICGSGYYCVSIKQGGQWYDRRINVLVANAFIPNPEGKPIAHHKDGNKLNNDVSNLVWVTPQEHGEAHRKLNQQARDNNGA